MKKISSNFFIFILFIILFSFSTDVSFAKYRLSKKRQILVRYALGLKGIKYKSGGNTPLGFDCSGFVQYVYKRIHVKLPRTASAQYKVGHKISFTSIHPGDLLFFHTGRKIISHVGIYIGGGKFIHSPRTGKRVSVADLKIKYWQKRYIGAITYFVRKNRYKRYRRKNNNRRKFVN